MQNRYTADIGDYVKFGILRALLPGHRLGVIWCLYPDESHNSDGQHVQYLSQPDRWRHYDPELFDSLGQIVISGQRHVAAVEAANILPSTTFVTDVILTMGPFSDRRVARQRWFQNVSHKVDHADLVFIDPDNGLEPDGYSHGSVKAGKSITLAELQALARPGRCLIVYHHQTRRKGGHHAEIEHWGARLRQVGFRNVDALRASRGSARVFFVLDAPNLIRERSEEFAQRWHGHVSWHADAGINFEPTVGDVASDPLVAATSRQKSAPVPDEAETTVSPPASAVVRPPRRQSRRTTAIGYVNRNDQEVMAATGKPGNDHGQYVYVLRCQACGHEYGANGSDIWLRRCPAHDGGAPGLALE